MDPRAAPGANARTDLEDGPRHTLVRLAVRAKTFAEGEGVFAQRPRAAATAAAAEEEDTKRGSRCCRRE